MARGRARCIFFRGGEMDKRLTQEELNKTLEHMFKAYEYNFINVKKKPPKIGKQAYNQIKELIRWCYLGERYAFKAQAAEYERGLRDAISLIKEGRKEANILISKKLEGGG